MTPVIERNALALAKIGRGVCRQPRSHSAIAHGKVETATTAAPSVLPLPGIEIVLNAESFVFCPTPVLLPDGRGPPVLFSVS